MKQKIFRRNAPWFVGLGMLAMTILVQTFTSVYMFYYVEVLGLSLVTFTLAKTVYMIWDALNDPLSGVISDRTRSKLGRRRFWLIIISPLLVIGFIMVFTPPGAMMMSGSKVGLAWWLLLSLMVIETACGFLWVNYETVYPEIYSGDRERSKGETWKVVFEILGILLSAGIGLSIYYALGATNMALVISGVYLLLMGGCVATIRENPKHQEEPRIKVWKSFRETLSNKPFWAFNIANLLAQTVNATMAGLLLFFGKYCLKIDDDRMTIVMIVAFAPVVGLVFVWDFLVRKWGAKKAWQRSLLIFAFCCIPMFFANSFITGIIAAFFVGFGMAGYLMTPGVMRGRIVDEDVRVYGQRREGVITSTASFIRQISPIVSAGIVLIMGLLTGYKSGEEPGPYPEITFRILLSIVPVILLVSAYFISRGCKGFDEDLPSESIE